MPLVLRRGAAGDVVPEVAARGGRGGRVLEPALRRRGARGRHRREGRACGSSGLEVASFAASLLFEPWTVQTGSGTPFSVFTPFWKACRALPEPRHPLPEPDLAGGPAASGDALEDWDLRPATPDWAGGLRELWTPGERGRPRAAGGVPARRHRRLRRRPRHARRPRDVAAVAAPALGRGQPVPGLARGRRPPAPTARASRGSSPSSDGASSPRTCSSTSPTWRPATGGRSSTPSPGGRWTRRSCARGSGAHGHPGRGCRDARALDHRDDAQPRAHDHGVVPHEEPADRLAHRRAVVLGHARRCRWRQQPVQLAVGGGSGADAAPYFRVFNPELQAKKFDRTVRRRWAPETSPGRRGSSTWRIAQGGARRLRGDAQNALIRGQPPCASRCVRRLGGPGPDDRIAMSQRPPTSPSPAVIRRTAALAVPAGEQVSPSPGWRPCCSRSSGSSASTASTSQGRHGILKLITLGGFGIWWLIDVILVIASAMRDKNGCWSPPVRTA